MQQKNSLVTQLNCWNKHFTHMKRQYEIITSSRRGSINNGLCLLTKVSKSLFFFFTPLDSHLGKNKMGEIKELLITNIPQHFQVFFLSSFLPSFLPFFLVVTDCKKGITCGRKNFE